jgi:glycosyltransferase involved in cell wall biosynthesis
MIKLSTLALIVGAIVIIIILYVTLWDQLWFELRRNAKAERSANVKRLQSNLSAADKKGTIVWLMRAYLPNVKAGAEITAHELNKYLVSAGWRVIIVLHDWKQESLDGVELVKFDPEEGDAQESIFRSADVFFCQNYVAQDALKVLEPYSKPIVYFLHIEKEKQDVLQTRFGVPLAVVYNSLTQKEQNPTVHSSTIVRPFIEWSAFKPRSREIMNGPVVLLNCNENKGGSVLQELAKEMRDVPFVGIKGAYSKQLADDGHGPNNLTYRPLVEDPRPIYEEAGVVIMPSKSESWGRVALEAMASGVPVIVSTAGGLRESSGGAAAATCRIDDMACWSQTIRRLRSDAEFYRGCVGSGLRRVEDLSRQDDFGDFERWLIEQFAEWRGSDYNAAFIEAEPKSRQIVGEAYNAAFTFERPDNWEG